MSIKNLINSLLVLSLFIACDQRTIIHITKEPLIYEKHFYKISDSNNLSFEIESILKKNKTTEYFSLPYYLIPKESTKLFSSKFSSSSYLSQIQTVISGKEHLKYFLLPDNAKSIILELKGRFHYVEPNESEFYAAVLNNDEHKMIVWSKKNSKATPFIISLENRPSLSLELIEANQKSIPLITKKEDLENLNIDFENASIRFDLPLKSLPNLEQVLKINAFILNENESKLSKVNEIFLRNVKFQISHLDFIKNILHKDFLNTIHEITLKNGYVLNPELSNLNLILSKQKKFQIGITEIENIFPDLLIMDKINKQSVYYTKRMNEEKYKLFETSIIFKSFLDNYADHIFINYTRSALENNYITYKEMNELNSNFKKDLKILYSQYLTKRIDASKLKIIKESIDNNKALSYIELKKLHREWVDLENIRYPASDKKFYFTENAFYQVSGNIIIGYGFYNQNEKLLFQFNKQIPFFNQD